jgi:ABC-type Fe3+/spermidine/putrescine transport system ATPase subunit
VEHNSTGKVKIEGDPPYLIFGIRVINRTNYYFTPKESFLACYHGEDLVFKENWEEKAKTPHIIISELQRLGDGSIQFHVSREKIGNNMGELTLKGYVEYATEDDIIHNTQRKSVRVDITKLEYTLDEETAPEPKGKVLIAK